MEKRTLPTAKVIMAAFAKGLVITNPSHAEDVLAATPIGEPVFVHAYHIEAVRHLVEQKVDSDGKPYGFDIGGRAAFCVYPDQQIKGEWLTGYINTTEYGDKLVEPALAVNWAGCGTQNLAATRAFALRLLDMCNQLEDAVLPDALGLTFNCKAAKLFTTEYDALVFAIERTSYTQPRDIQLKPTIGAYGNGVYLMATQCDAEGEYVACLGFVSQ